MPPRGHAILSPSSAERWIHCPPSAIDNANAPRTDTAYTREGTVAHALAEAKASLHFGLCTQTAYEASVAAIRKAEEYTEEMEIHTDRYVECLQTIYDSFAERPKVCLETKLSFEDWMPDGFGTADCIMVGMDAIVVCDFKYGQGVKVAAESNPQMMIYALGVLAKYGDLFEQRTISMAIIQPRIVSEPDIFTVYREDLEAWAENTLKPAAQLAFKGEGERKCGAWCKWCCNHGKCRAEFDEFDDLPVEKGTDELLPEEIDKALKLGELLTGWIDAVKAYALALCMNGTGVPGYKAVEGRSNRNWTDQQKAFDRAVEIGYPAEMLYERKPLSVAALEKAMGKKAFAEFMKDFVTKDPGKPTLAPESDRHPALKTETVEDDFKEDI